MTDELETLDPLALYKVAMEHRDRGDVGGAERVLVFGMGKFQSVVDQFGHPPFHKELVRMLAEDGQYARALAVAPAKAQWHYPLFARAYAARGRQDEAEQWWRRVLEHERGNGEARVWLFNNRYGYQNGSYPSPFGEMISGCNDLAMDTIFDVGANEGQSCLEYAKLFPKAKIYSFEPMPQTFAVLQRNSADRPNIKPVALALTDSDGKMSMQSGPQSSMSRVGGEGGVAVRAARLESYCRDEGIGRINFLKIDTEGHDLAVLRGCGDFIERIDFIQCEASANDYNTYHTPYADIFRYLTDKGFYLFGIFGQTAEWTGGGYPVLRRIDPVFINRRIVGELKGVVTAAPAVLPP